MNGYQLTRRWFDFAFEHKEVKPQHTALYCWCVELNNRLQWKQSFGLPTDESCEYTGIGNRKTFYSALDDLKKWGFIEVIQESKNQNQSRIISLCLCENEQAHTQAGNKQSESNDSGTAPIVKPYKPKNNKTIKHSIPEFDFLKYGELSKLIEDFANHRKSIKKPFMSEHAVNLIVKKLKSLSQGNYQLAEAIIEKAIANGWQGIFPLSESKKNTEPPAQANQNYYPPKPENDPFLLRQEVHSNYEDYVRHCLKVGHQPEKPKYPELVPPDFDHIAFINQIKSNL